MFKEARTFKPKLLKFILRFFDTNTIKKVMRDIKDEAALQGVLAAEKPK